MADLPLKKCVLLAGLVGGASTALMWWIAQYEPLSEIASPFVRFLGPGIMAVVVYGTPLLPKSLTAPYDPVGNPGLYVLGVLLQLWLIAFLAILTARWILRRRSAS